MSADIKRKLYILRRMEMNKSNFTVGIICAMLVIGFVLVGCGSNANIDVIAVGETKLTIGYDYFDATKPLEEQSVFVMGSPKIGQFFLTKVDGVKTGWGVGSVTIFPPGKHSLDFALFYAPKDRVFNAPESFEVNFLPGHYYYLTSDVEVLGPFPAGIRWLKSEDIDNYSTVYVQDRTLPVDVLKEGIKTAVEKRLTQDQ
jgi:hypothetical protein